MRSSRPIPARSRRLGARPWRVAVRAKAAPHLPVDDRAVFRELYERSLKVMAEELEELIRYR